jgi:hypothetical protein
MTRLSALGNVSQQLGMLLNEFLQVAHHDDGTLRGVCTVINVRDFHIATDETADSTNAVRAAAEAIPDDGGILFFPPGLYSVNPTPSIKLKPRTWVLGSGRSSVIQSIGRVTIFEGQGVTGVRVSNLTFRMDMDDNVNNQYLTAVEFNQGASDIMIDSCKFEAINVPPGGVTLHAVLAKAVSELWVVNNWISQMQIRMGSEAQALNLNVMGPAIIANNQIKKPRNFAISATQFIDPAEMLDLQICNNNIHDPAGQGGIYVGTDNDNHRIKSLKRLVIQGNNIAGQWSGEGDEHNHKQSIGILVRPAETSEQILITGNVITKSGDPDAGAEVTGINIEGTTLPTTMRGLTITHNSLQQMNYAGIIINGSQETAGIIIAYNTVTSGGGITIRRGNIRDAIIEGNYLEGPGGLYLEAFPMPVPNTSLQASINPSGHTMGPVLLRGNICKNSSNNGITLHAKDINTCISAEVINNICYDDQIPKTQKYGIAEIGEPKQFNTHYVGNDVRGNLDGGFLVTAAAALHSNRGWATENTGTAIIPADTTQVTIAHALKSASPASDITITITPTNNPSNQPGYLWISHITDTQFTVNCANSPGGSGLSFAWHAAVLKIETAPC